LRDRLVVDDDEHAVERHGLRARARRRSGRLRECGGADERQDGAGMDMKTA
jgi:hypothetical protein